MIQFGLAAMACFIFVVFFAQNIVMLAIGYHLCGWAWGTFQASVVSYASEITPVALRGYLTVSGGGELLLTTTDLCQPMLDYWTIPCCGSAQGHGGQDRRVGV